MSLSFGRAIPNPEIEAVTIPRNAACDTTALMSISDQWSGLVTPGRPSSAVRKNVESLVSTLSSVGRHSLHQLDRSPPTELSIVRHVVNRCPVNTYEAGLLFSVVEEVTGREATLEQFANGFLIRSSFFQIGLYQEEPSDDHHCLMLAVSDQAYYQTVLDKFEERDQALAAGRVFAQAIRNVVDSIEDLAQSNTPVDLGRYVFQGPPGPAAAAALLARNIPNTILPATIPPEGSLATIIASLPSRRVTEITPGMLYEITADFVSFRLQLTEQGEIALSAHLHPEQLVRDSSLWFSSSTVAKEITSILFATGVVHTLPKLVEHAAEKHTNLRWGNGYASLSRMICGMICHSRELDLTKLQELNTLYDGTLGHHLVQFRNMSSSTATHLVLDLLVGALEPRTPDAALPAFRGPRVEEDPHVNSCEDAEGYFVSSIRFGNYTCDSHFLYKGSGENTALNRVPIVIEGTYIPKGTLCYVQKNGDAIEWVQPVRLTLFNLPLDGEGPEVFRHHLDKMGDNVGPNDDAVRAVYRALDT